MSILSNNSRLVVTLPIASTLVDSDDLIIQNYSGTTNPNGITKRIKYSVLSDLILDSSNFNPYSGIVNFTNGNNRYTGSFFNLTGAFANLFDVTVRNNLVVNGNATISSLSVDSINTKLTGSVNGWIRANSSTPLSTVSGSLSGSFYGKSIGRNAKLSGSFSGSHFGQFIGKGAKLSGSFSGSYFGRVVSSKLSKLSGSFNGTASLYGRNYISNFKNSGKSVAFNGTSSYAVSSSFADTAISAAFATTATATNGLPTGGSRFQVLAKNSGTNYDVIFTNPVTQSVSGVISRIPMWGTAASLTNTDLIYDDALDKLTLNGSVECNKITSSYLGTVTANSTDYTITSAGQQRKIFGNLNGASTLHLSASGNVTMSLYKGQTATVLVKNSGSFKVYKWSGSLNGNTSANTKIYWKLGISSSISSGNGKKDVITFVNINNYIFASPINDFR